MNTHAALAESMEQVARILLGEPNKSLSSRGELRYGNKGSLSVDLSKGTFFDHERNEGGGVLDLVRRETGEDPIKWLRENELIDDGTIVATFDYLDENKKLLFQVCRTSAKKFFQRQPNGRGGWIKNIKGVRRVLYRLPELLASQGQGTVFITEGEKHVDALAVLGLRATCNPMGASKWNAKIEHEYSYSQHLRDEDVVILPDNDPQTTDKNGNLLFHPDGRPRFAGQDHAQEVARNLHGVARRVRVLMLPGLKPKGDVINWLEAGGTREELEKLAADAKDWVASDRDSVSLEDFIAYMPSHSYVYVPSREMWPAISVNAQIPPVPLLDAHGNPMCEDGKPILMKANAWLDQNQHVEQMTWAPGLPMLIRDRLIAEGGWIERNGVTCFNLYRPPTLEPGDAKKADRWLDHVHKVFGDDAEHIIRWLAQRVQRPQEKINHALVFGGTQGIGKDTLLEPARYAVGPWNFQEISPQQILGRFNGYLKRVILRVNEARDLGDVNRYHFYDHTKSYTAAPPDVLMVDEKHLREYSITNCLGMILTSNYKTNGIYLPAEDRRHFVAWSNRKPEDFAAGYWNGLWTWYLAEQGNQHVATYLAELDISSFDPKAPPPKTPAFWDIVDANRAPEDAELLDVLDRLNNPRVTTLAEIVHAAGTEFAIWLSDRRYRRQIPHRFEQCGYVPVRNPADKRDGLWSISGARQVVYAQRDLSIREQHEAVTEFIARTRRPDDRDTLL
jgi:hypothetical protein